MSTQLKVIFVFLGGLIGILLTSQFFADVPVNSKFLLDQIEAQKQLRKIFTNEQLALQNKVAILRARVDEANKKFASSGVIEKRDSLKNAIGLGTARGKGLEITLDDGQQIERTDGQIDTNNLVHAADLRDLVNTLRASNAQAIAVNNQRILTHTPIISVGNNVLVNTINIAPPFVISAVGDQDLMIQRLDDVDVLPDLKVRVNETKVQMTVTPKATLTINSYNGAFKTKYIGE